jgi:arylformamidase
VGSGSHRHGDDSTLEPLDHSTVRRMRIYDVTRPIWPGMPVYPGDPPVRIEPWLSLGGGDPVNVSALALGSHTGTHVDAPRHLSHAGPGVDALPLDRLVGPARLLDVDAADAVDAACLCRALPRGGALPARLLLRARRLPAAEHPHLTEDAAALLVARGVGLVGVEGDSVDAPSAPELPVHRRLLENGVIILENVDLTAVPAGDYLLACLPLALRDADGAPARVVLLHADTVPSDDSPGR